jgi:large subunit ribosomal protein L13
MLAKKPGTILREAVRRMMPKNKLARHQLTKLKIYAGPKHPHQAQQPQPLKVEG